MNAHTIKTEFLQAYEPQHQAFVRYCASRAYGLLDVEDLVQESLLRALEGYERLRDKERLLGFLIGIANNIVRKHSRRRKFRTDWDEDLLAGLESKLQNAELAMDIHYLHRAIERLPERARETVLLFHISDRSIADIARQQGRSEGAVKTELSRARKQLRTWLTDAPSEVKLTQRFQVYASILL